MDLMHLGAYFDPGMESNLPEDINNYSKADLEAIFDKEFSTNGIKIIKSHIFSNHIDFIKATWPDCPIVLVHRPDDACLGWWVKCGHFDITYPLYKEYYKDLRTMSKIIKEQNAGIIKATYKYPSKAPLTNQMLAKMLNIELPPKDYFQDYGQSDVRVTVI
jgi:hypothetical protein